MSSGTQAGVGGGCLDPPPTSGALPHLPPQAGQKKKKEGGKGSGWVLAYCLARTLPACKLWVLVMRWTCRGVPWCVGATSGPV